MQTVDAGDVLYTLVRGALGPDYDADLPQLLRIQHTIERPSGVQLTAPEAKVRDGLGRTLDAVTALEVAVGLLQSDALTADREVSLESLTPAERGALRASLAQYRAIQGGAEIPDVRPTVLKWHGVALPAA
ncbi:MAG: hypothetical protein ACRD1C_03715 [Terriglobales bacterium]